MEIYSVLDLHSLLHTLFNEGGMEQRKPGMLSASPPTHPPMLSSSCPQALNISPNPKAEVETIVKTLGYGFIETKQAGWHYL